MSCRVLCGKKTAVASAVLAAFVGMHGMAHAAGPTGASPSGTAVGAGTNMAPASSAPNSGMIPNTGSGMIPNASSGSPTNPTNNTTANPNQMNPAVNPANANNSPNRANAANANTMGAAANWQTEDQFWRAHFSSQPYATSNVTYAMYQPAYRYGVNLFNQSGGKPFSSLDSNQLAQNWQQQRGNSTLTWPQAEAAARDAYDRLGNNQTGAAAVPSTP